MGLDLRPLPGAKPGCETEWRLLIERYFRDDRPDDLLARLDEIGVPSYADAGAPRVGFDSAADAWLLEARKAETPEDRKSALEEFRGHYALDLAGPPGIPKFSNGGCYSGVDATSFRGSWLKVCRNVISRRQIDQAYTNKWPVEAIDFGRELLRAADEAERLVQGAQPAPRSFWARLGLAKPRQSVSIDRQIEIVRAAGNWYVFWGDRGHPIEAWC